MTQLIFQEALTVLVL